MSVEVVLRLNGVEVPVTLDAVALGTIAAALAECFPTSGVDSPWLYGNRATADYLGWPLGRVEKLSAANAIPCHRVGRRLTFRRDELDAWLIEGADGRR